jgi:elongation factor P hydroxylase
MKQFVSALILSCGFAAVQAQAACDYPVAPGKFPDGTVASLDEMKAAKASVVKYNADMDTYLTCITGEYDAKVSTATAEKKLTPERKAEMDKVQKQKQDAAVEEVTAVTERFNEQLRAYKAKAAEKKTP